MPYYGTSETAYPDNQGCRRIYPADLDKVLTEVAQRRCAECHNEGKIPRRVWTRVTEPELNPFLVAPLAKSAGGLQLCGEPVFADKHDQDYRTMLARVEDASRRLQQHKRFDMPRFRPNRYYIREMQHFGILPRNLPAHTPIDPYTTDRAYWQTFQFAPRAP